MKIVYLECKSIGDDVSLKKYKEFGDLVTYPVAAVSAEETRARVRDADVILMNKTPMNAETLADADHVKLICEMATGYDNIDIEYCRSRGIAVANAGHYSTTAVAQHTFALLLFLMEKLSFYDNYVKSGSFCRASNFTYYANPILELAGRTWGIVGMGEIGSRVAAIAEAFGCRVIHYASSGSGTEKRSLQPDALKDESVNGRSCPRVTWEELLASSDIISLHCPLTDRTRHLFDDDAFRQMKDTAYLINVSRGPVVDENALYRALTENRIAGAGLDVLEKEPMDPTNPLLKIKDSDRLIITPHNAWASVEARQRDADITFDNIRAFLDGKMLNRIL